MKPHIRWSSAMNDWICAYRELDASGRWWWTTRLGAGSSPAKAFANWASIFTNGHNKPTT